MGLFRRAVDLEALPLDWRPLATVACRTLPLSEPSEAAVRGALADLPDADLLSAAVHAARLARAAADEQTARLLPRHPFVDWTRPWNAGAPATLPGLALRWAYAQGLRTPDGTARALGTVAADPRALAGLLDLPEALLDEGVVASIVLQLTLPGLAAQRFGGRTRPSLPELLPPEVPGQHWPGTPPDHASRRWQWDLTWDALDADGFDREPHLELLAPVERQLSVSAARGLPFVPSTDSPVAEWHELLSELLDLTLAVVLDRARADPLDPAEPEGRVFFGPWTVTPFHRLSVRVVVVPGGDVEVTEPGPRQLSVVLPVDPGRLAPLEETALAFVRTVAAVLLQRVPDLTPLARSVLEEEVAGRQETVDELRSDLDEMLEDARSW